MQTRKPILILAVLVVLAVAPALSFAEGTPAPSFTPDERTEHERTAAREGRHRVEEHRDHRSR
jgi:hypothetical protein